MDLTGVDYLAPTPRTKVVYWLHNPITLERLRIIIYVARNESIPSVTDIWEGANWYERELYDLFGVHSTGHPNMKRILMPDDWKGRPLQRDYALTEVPVEFKPESNPKFHRKSSLMSKLSTKQLEELVASGDVMELNLGPQHPSTHGVLRLKLHLEGEIVVSAEPVIGYLHTGIEKTCETRTYHQVFTLVDRIDYLSGPAEEQAYAGAVERLMNLEVPQRAQTIRIMILELSRIQSHLIWLGTSALELNMSSVFMYCMAEREKILDLFEGWSGRVCSPPSGASAA